MTRPLRLHVPGGLYHVTLRGNHRQHIFFSDADHERLDIVVAEAIERCAARVHAYCWMTNHLHLLVQVSDAPLGRLMLRIASQYARAVQARFNTTGHLFERRYHAVLADASDYLLTLVRYIHLNPVRAGLVADPADYAWSSHRVYLGLQRRDWVTTTLTFGLLTGQSDKAVDKYRGLIASSEPCRWGIGMLAPHRDQARILGGDAFVAKVIGPKCQLRSRKSLDDLIGECCERFQLTPLALASASRSRHLAAARAWIGHEAVAGQVASVSEVARRLGRSESAIRQIMNRRSRAASGQ